MNDTQRRIEKFLREEGFVILRFGKHTTWTDGKVVVTTPKSVSDRRAYMNKVTEVRRLRRLGQSRVRIGGASPAA